MSKERSRRRRRQRSKPNGRANPHSAHRQQDKLTIRLRGLPGFTLSLGPDERECYDSLELPPKAQAFRALERRRNDASYGLHQQQQNVDALKRQLREACHEVRRYENTLGEMKDYLAVLSEDHMTDFRQMDYTDTKAARKPGERYYATTSCWMCGGRMPLEDFKPQRAFCNNTCAQEAKRRRSRMLKLAPAKKSAPPRVNWPCPYCARPMSGEELAKASRPHHLDPKARKRFQREQQVLTDVYGSDVGMK